MLDSSGEFYPFGAAFCAQLCRVPEAGPGSVLLEFVRADTLADAITALPVTGYVDLAPLVPRCSGRGGVLERGLS
jgi:hypothetical protein